MIVRYRQDLKQLSRELRNKSTLAEVLLWNQLKQRKMLGYQFARQKPIWDYIVDFYCPKLKLVVEIDGDSHRDRFATDLRRQQLIQNMGIHFLRFNDLDVKKDMGNVLQVIGNWITQQRKTTP